MKKTSFQKFFSPVFSNKLNFIKAVISGIFSSFFLVINIFFIQKFVYFFQNNIYDELDNFIIYFLLFNILYFIFSYFTRRWSWSDLFYSNIKILHRKYMLEFNKLDNTNVE